MKNSLLRELPSIDELLRSERLAAILSAYSVPLVTEAARTTLDRLRKEIITGQRETLSDDEISSAVIGLVEEMIRPGVVPVINATGTILHTNIGRALLSKEAADAVRLAAEKNINLEFDLATGERGERDGLVEGLLKRLTGAEAACVVNNNAAAVLITLNTLAEGKEVVISRGELIEIGGSFRLPEIIKKSGCVLKEVGTTNRTHLKDYTDALTGSALILKAHTSNYRVVGFTAEVELKDLVAISRERKVYLVEDLGSGSLIDLSFYGLPREPLVSESVGTGVDIVTFSGDKLLGGPQAGLIAGRREIVDKIRKNPLKRALRADKFTLSALEATLRLYLNRDTLAQRLPTLRFMTRSVEEIGKIARRAAELLKARLGPSFEIGVEDNESVVGAGSLPGHSLPTKVVAITHKTEKAEKIFEMFLHNDPPILGRVKKEKFLLDMRTVEMPEDVVPLG
jgi:L-seryl-tRNA(Ser) seleniumtransferase